MSDEVRPACQDRDPDLWFPKSHSRANDAPAKAICRGCPARAACLQLITAHPSEFGIYAGLSPVERQPGWAPPASNPQLPAAEVAARLRAARKVLADPKLGYQAVAEEFGLTRAVLATTIRILRYAPHLEAGVRDGTVSFSAAAIAAEKANRAA